jgi:hypothetical protein
MPTLSLRAIRTKVLPLLSALDQEVVQPGLRTASQTMAQVVNDLDCRVKEPWIRGAHRHAALHGALARFAARQQGWTRYIYRGIPIYRIGDGLELTVKRTPQGRAASSVIHPFAATEFDLAGHEQQSFLEAAFYSESPVTHVVALDFVARADGRCLTALLYRRSAKVFDPLACVASTPALRLALPASSTHAPPKRTGVVPRRKKAEDQDA